MTLNDGYVPVDKCQGRRNFRVMKEQCPSPERPSRTPPGLAMVMEPRYGTILNDGSLVEGHDDWHCIQDLAAAGYFDCGPEDVQPGAIIHLSESGRAVVRALRAHKAAGGTFKSFRVSTPES
jgi:hypothetical protein